MVMPVNDESNTHTGPEEAGTEPVPENATPEQAKQAIWDEGMKHLPKEPKL